MSSAVPRRGGKAGRTRAIPPELAEKIFRELGWLALFPEGRRWRRPPAAVAREFGVSVRAILRAADEPRPDGVTPRRRACSRRPSTG